MPDVNLSKKKSSVGKSFMGVLRMFGFPARATGVRAFTFGRKISERVAKPTLPTGNPSTCEIRKRTESERFPLVFLIFQQRRKWANTYFECMGKF